LQILLAVARMLLPHLLFPLWLAYFVKRVLGAPKKDEIPRTELSDRCSRPISRLVRKQMEKEIYQPAARAGHVNWPVDCPLQPGKDLFFHHESQKTRKRPGSGGSSWTCGVCGKSFLNEHYLDLHLENKHASSMSEEHTCLADYCELFEVCEEKRRRPQRAREEEKCNQDHLAKVRHTCDDSMRKCFPLDGSASAESRKLHAQMSRHWCQQLDCVVREEKRKEEESSLVPVVVLLILIVFIGFLFFAIIVCCVDYSDDIVLWFQDSGLMSAAFARKLFKARKETQKKVGVVDRTKSI